MSKQLVIGLTGPTGAGKSEVARVWAASGCYVIDADVLSRRAVEPDSQVLRAIAERFSTAVLNADGTLNRKALAQQAFSSPEETAALNAIVHPAVCRMIEEELKRAAKDAYAVAVIDAPLLFEAGVDALCDTTVAVLAPNALRRNRICERDGLTVQQADLRMSTQPQDEFYREKASRVIVNDGDIGSLREQAKTLLLHWKGQFGA